MNYAMLVLGLIMLGGVLVFRNQTGRHATLAAEKRELNDLLDEARLVKSELEELLRETVKVSEQLVHQVETRLITPLVNDNQIGQTKDEREDAPELKRHEAMFREIKSNVKTTRKSTKQSRPNPNKVLRDSSNIISLAESMSAENRLLDRYGQIYHLAEQGWSIREIAQALNLGQGEVELVLELKKKQTMYNQPSNW
ncbi:MAG: hypothetical protein HPY81_00560 [Firmicutes bacterium]|nr:hypothetical protein [Bacillota bacterium]